MKAGPNYPYAELGFAAGKWGHTPAAQLGPAGHPWTLQGQDFADFLGCIDLYVNGKPIPKWCQL